MICPWPLWPFAKPTPRCLDPRILVITACWAGWVVYVLSQIQTGRLCKIFCNAASISASQAVSMRQGGAAQRSAPGCGAVDCPFVTLLSSIQWLVGRSCGEEKVGTKTTHYLLRTGSFHNTIVWRILFTYYALVLGSILSSQAAKMPRRRNATEPWTVSKRNREFTEPERPSCHCRAFGAQRPISTLI